LDGPTTSLADKVRHARLEAGLTQAQLAGGEVDPVTIHRIESGRVKPTRRVLSHIAKRVGKPVRHFVEDGGPDDAEIECALLRGRIRRAAGDLDSAQRMFEASEELAIAAADVSRTALARVESAAMRLQRGWTAQHESDLTAAQAEAARFGHLHAVAYSEYAHAVALHAHGDRGRARKALLAALAVAGELSPALRAQCLAELIAIAVEQGEESAELEVQMNSAAAALDPLHAADLWEAQAIEAESSGNLSGAVDAGQRALMIRETLAMKKHEAAARYHIGQAARNHGRADEALAELDRAHALANEAGDALTEAQSLVAMAEVYTACGRITEACGVLEQARGAFSRVAQTDAGVRGPATRAVALEGLAGRGDSSVRSPVRALHVLHAECPAAD